MRKRLDAEPDCIRTSVGAQHFPMKDPRAGGTIYIWTLGPNKTPHVVAREFGHEHVVALLMDRTPDDLKLAMACELGEEEPFRAMLAANPGLVSALSEEARRRLPDAAHANNLRAVRLMLDAGWPADAKGQHGGTALHWACFHGNPQMTRDILARHPPLEDADNDFHSTPLGWATHGSEHGWRRQTGDYPAAVELLCAAGARVPDKLSGTASVQEVLRRYAAGENRL